MNQPLYSGQWDDNLSWEFYETTELPDATLCTAVYCLALTADDGIVLTRNHRGWEMLGGHVERGETIEAALFRECLEEGGYVPESYRLFGYRRVTAKRPTQSPLGGYYPFPTTYIPHFVATSALPLQAPTGQEILEARVFAGHELEPMQLEQYRLIQTGLQSHNRQA